MDTRAARFRGGNIGHGTNKETNRRALEAMKRKFLIEIEVECSEHSEAEGVVEDLIGNAFWEYSFVRETTKKKRTGFIKPDILDITEEFKAKGTAQPATMAAKFWNHYESNGWMVGKNKMKSWKGAVATWVLNNNQYGAHQQTKQVPKSGYSRDIQL